MSLTVKEEFEQLVERRCRGDSIKSKELQDIIKKHTNLTAYESIEPKRNHLEHHLNNNRTEIAVLLFRLSKGRGRQSEALAGEGNKYE